MKSKQEGFGAVAVFLIVVVLAVVAVAGVKVLNSSDSEPLANSVSTNGTTITEEESVILQQAKELKKIDFDLDGVNNDVDDDDDNDGINDDEDDDDNNDGVNDDEEKANDAQEVSE